MPTILVKGLSEETLKNLKRLKVELDCVSWAQLLEKLSRSRPTMSFTKKQISEMREGVKEFVSLANNISKRWHGAPTAVQEIGKARRHERDQAPDTEI